MQELRDLDTVVDSESYKRIYPEIGIKQFSLSRHDAFLGIEKGIEVFDKRRIETQEDGVKVLVEFLQLILHHRLLISHRQYLFQHLCLCLAIDVLAEFLKLADIV